MASKRRGNNRSSRQPQAGETNQGLVVTLVFFILATLGLGVATYFGFANQGEANDKAKAADDAKLGAESERDFYKFEVMLLKKYMGQLTPDKDAEFNTKFANYEGGLLPGDKAKKDEKDEKVLLDALVASLKGRPDDDQLPDKKVNLAFEAQGAGQPKSLTRNFDAVVAKYKAELEVQKKEVKRLTEANRALTTEKDKLASEKLQLEQSHKDEYGTLQTKLQEEKKEQGDNANKYRDLAEERSKKIGTLEQEKAALAAAAAATETNAKAAVAQSQVEKEKLRKTIEAFERPADLAPKNLNTGWKVVKVVPGDVAYINLGSADRVKPQLRFTVHGVESDGKPIERDKAVLEVVEVREPHLARGRIIYLEDRLSSGDRRHDRNRNPVLEGDVLVNPSWNPTVAKHVALVGVVDLTGEGRDNTEEFLRTLTRQNIVVDASIDARTVLDDAAVEAALKKVTVQTDFLVVAEVPRYLLESRGDDKRGAKLQAAIDKMKDAAKQNGVRVMGLRKYLEMIGYETPRVLDDADKTSSSIYRSKVESKPDAPKPDAPKPDAPKKDAPKKDDKPAD